MKKVIIFIEAPNDTVGLNRLKQDLKFHNIKVVDHLPKTWKEQSKDTLLITDQKDILKEAAFIGMACIGYEAPRSKAHIFGTNMVIQGFEEINSEFLQLIYQRNHGIPWTIAKTKRLLIRETVIEDFDTLYALYQEDGITDFMPSMGDKKEARHELEQYIKYMYQFFHYGLWTVVEEKSGCMIGRVGLDNQTYKGEKVIELGYMIGRKYQRKGYGTEAAKAAMNYAFEVLGVKELYLFIHKENRVSYALATNLGFTTVEEKNRSDSIQVLKVHRKNTERHWYE